tara:strand:+ start:851 stop:1036 length:186 start_codon:yes stop_codon:yes gene_type:complete
MDHPAIVVNDDVRKELLENLTKAELIEEVEWLKRQREELLKEIQMKGNTIRELQLNKEESK